MYLQDLADFASMHKESGNDVDYDDNSIDCDDLLDHDDRDSDEDTEDASETDMVKQREEECTEIKEQMYRDKLAMLKKQLTQLKEETHPEYLKRLRKIEQLYQERLFLNEVFQSHEVERVEREYLHEKKAAVREFEEKKIDLRESLIMDLEEKRRAIEAERSTVELTGDSMEVKSVTTRKLRRRPNDPLPMPEKRRKTSPTQLNFLLDDGEIVDDLKILSKGKAPSLSKRLDCEEYGNMDHGSHAIEARIEDGKLFYERKCYQRGQSVCVDSKDMGRFFGVISGVGTSEFWVKKTSDSGKVKIHLSQLLKGKVILRRKSAC
ncbi:sin3 histone deacetylase corepressor complex component SDS3 isoform X4 [Rhipicephalus microplus]|uniref:sin3 histone deacetylase corepressor complex component SDS3 isoform X4 n=1 Tax=Rhipicephalus microplus TaxID=6941 RepID=UPI001888A84D|nr:sin3 histone deacetylase corepressor complex component SDS3-like isoform X4 [Rhipicephalus microplus]